MLRRITAITLHTFKECVRDKVFYNLIFFALLMIGAAIVFGKISVGIQRIILVNLGLAAISIFGLLMAIFTGISLVWKEVERKTLYNVLSKPVSRVEFILGKFFGLFLTLLVNTAVMTAGFYLALWIEEQRFEFADLAPLEAIYFILLEFAIIVGLALLFSCFSTPALSGVFTISLVLIGNFLDDIRWFGAQTGNAALGKITLALYYLLPDIRRLNMISGAAHGLWAPHDLLVANTLYALLYVTVLISASILIFEERELV
jgi:ABC-type transport system involved in multi-copper enzyme maturation permease subunit